MIHGYTWCIYKPYDHHGILTRPECPHRGEAQLGEFLQAVHDGQRAGGIQTWRGQPLGDQLQKTLLGMFSYVSYGMFIGCSSLKLMVLVLVYIIKVLKWF